MTGSSGPGGKPGRPPAPGGPPSPKRGAFPSPRSDIEKAKPYVADVDRTANRPDTNPTPLADADEKKGD